MSNPSDPNPQRAAAESDALVSIDKAAAAPPANTDERALIVLQVNVVKVGSGYVAAGKLGDYLVQANRKTSQLGAVQDVFVQLNNPNNPAAAVALDMALAGLTPDNLTGGFRFQ